ncbi:MAG: hypothetical protein LBI56_01645, partial [Puniceicoccales bacterium]|nr:hypothetical protein [Puniceicoccales bacterium]
MSTTRVKDLQSRNETLQKYKLNSSFVKNSGKKNTEISSTATSLSIPKKNLSLSTTQVQNQDNSNQDNSNQGNLNQVQNQDNSENEVEILKVEILNKADENILSTEQKPIESQELKAKESILLKKIRDLYSKIRNKINKITSGIKAFFRSLIKTLGNKFLRSTSTTTPSFFSTIVNTITDRSLKPVAEWVIDTILATSAKLTANINKLQEKLHNLSKKNTETSELIKDAGSSIASSAATAESTEILVWNLITTLEEEDKEEQIEREEEVKQLKEEKEEELKQLEEQKEKELKQLEEQKEKELKQLKEEKEKEVKQLE